MESKANNEGGTATASKPARVRREPKTERWEIRLTRTEYLAFARVADDRGLTMAALFRQRMRDLLR